MSIGLRILGRSLKFEDSFAATPELEVDIDLTVWLRSKYWPIVKINI